MNKIARILIVICLIYSCSHKRRSNFDEQLIEKIALEDFSLPSQYNMYYLYAECKNGQVAEIDIQQLRALYNDKTKGKTFESYLKAILNQNQKLEKSNDVLCFSLDEEIMKEYQKINFQNFIEKYFEKNNNSYRLKRDISSEKRKTIFYCCFLNNYIGTFDDYIGFYYIIKTSKL